MFEKIDDYHQPWEWKQPRGVDEHLLYLDFDGVLHHENCLWHPRRGPYLVAPTGHVLFQHASLLVDVLAPYPQWKLVLSTSWVVQYGCYQAAKRLPEELRNRVIGATFHSQMNRALFQSMPRGMQVWKDVGRRYPKAWIALDDQGTDWPTECLANFIQTDEVLGISEASVLARLKAALAELSRD